MAIQCGGGSIIDAYARWEILDQGKVSDLPCRNQLRACGVWHQRVLRVERLARRRRDRSSWHRPAGIDSRPSITRLRSYSKRVNSPAVSAHGDWHSSRNSVAQLSLINLSDKSGPWQDEDAFTVEIFEGICDCIPALLPLWLRHLPQLPHLPRQRRPRASRYPAHRSEATDEPTALLRIGNIRP